MTTLNTRPHLHLLLLLILAVGLTLPLISTVKAGPLDLDISSSSSSIFNPRSGNLVGDLDEFEFELDSEVHRRILATGSYISYGALNKNRVPCSRRGASYYNCRPGASSNPYTRGCSNISRCRRS